MINRSLRILAVSIAVGYTLTYLVLALVRLRYPFELEWMEGSMVDHVQRILDGGPLYVRPTIEFAPYLYTPLFYYVSAAVALVTGIGFVPLRVVSILASLGSFALVYVLVRHETRSRSAALLGVGIFAATYRLSGAWFDIGRVDSLLLVLVLGAVTLVRLGRSTRAWALAGVLLVLAFFAKQVGLTIALPVVAFAILQDRRRGALLGAIALGGTALGIAVMQVLHDGWFWFYTFDIPGSHAIEHRFFVQFWTRDLFGPFWPASAAGLAYGLDRLIAARDDRRHLFYPFVLSGVLVGAWLGRLHTGGWENVLIPAYAWLSVGAAAASHRLVVAAARANVRAAAPLATAAASVLLLLQFWLLAYNPVAQLPTKEDERAGWRFIELLRNTPGEVWVFDHGYLPRLAGKHPHAPSAAIWDILRAEKGTDVARELVREIETAVRQQQFTAILLDTQREFPTAVQPGYREEAMVFGNADVFWPLTGFQKRPDFLFRAQGTAVAAAQQGGATPVTGSR